MSRFPRAKSPFSRPATRSALVATFAGLSLGTNYALAGLPNVKLMDTFNFLATYLFGLSVGLPTVILTRAIYASVNPYGPASAWLIGLLIVGDSLYAISGWLTRRLRLLERSQVAEKSAALGLIGLFSALGFDVVTNFGSGLLAVTGPDLQTHIGRALVWGLVTMNFPIPMGILHEVADFVFFSTIIPAALFFLRRMPWAPQHTAEVSTHIGRSETG